MKRRVTLGLALALALGLAVAPAGAEREKIRVDSTVTFRHASYDLSTNTTTFSGKVRGEKRNVRDEKYRCVPNRTVKLRNEDIFVGSDVTDKQGNWEISRNANDLHSDDFKVTVKRKIVKEHKKIICKKDSELSWRTVSGP
jgi:hypothetical protein